MKAGRTAGVLLGFSLSLSALAASASSPATQHPLRILTYDSMLGKGSFGAYLESEFKKSCEGCALEFIAADDFGGLLGRLRQAKSGKASKANFDAVLGVDQRIYDIAMAEGLVTQGVAFDESPFAIIVDTEKLKPADWPKSWAEIPEKLAGKLLVQDPRLSSPGIGWLRSIYELKLLDKAQAKRAVRRVFPSWSDAYSAFLKGEGSAVWSYRSSEAYHLCNDEPAKKNRYKALPLREGYPKQVEYFARAFGTATPEALNRFEKFLLSPASQGQLATTQWMFPVDSKAALPDCYQSLTPIKAIEWTQPLGAKLFQSWLDQWSL